MSIERLIEMWLERSPSAATREQYGHTLKLWDEFAAEHGVGPWENRTLDELTRFAEWLHGRVTPRTASQRCEVIRSLVNFLCRHEAIQGVSPALDWRGVETMQELKRNVSLDAEQMRDLLVRTKNPHHRLFIEFLFETGCRISEALGLQWDENYLWRDPNDAGVVVILRGKGLKERSIRLGLEWLARFDTLRAEGLPSPFPWSRMQGWRIVHRAGARIGVDLSPHDLRHLHTTWRLNAGQPLLRVQHDLGHASPKTTAKYYDITPDHLASDGLPDLQNSRQRLELMVPSVVGSGGKRTRMKVL